MAAPMELSCWGGGWGLPSVHSESLVVLVRPPRGPGRGRTGLASRGLRWRPAGRLQASGPGGPAALFLQLEKHTRGPATSGPASCIRGPQERGACASPTADGGGAWAASGCL
ncbi:mCG114980, isoform CRA_b [Mus musculus]|nr:mCG114980, isoform CRA_b [Mus musculus]